MPDGGSAMRVSVAVPPRPYQAIIENGLLDKAGAYLRDLGVARTPSPGNRRAHQIFVITVPQVRRRWGKKLLNALAAAECNAHVLEMRDGEPHKKLATVEALAEKMVRRGADRDSMIIAFGGGVVGDTAGLLASVYMRGIDLVQIPTTVLAQLDASIGGKTGVNLRAGKNLIGTFHQPRAVLIDPALLSSLPEREFRAGLYESLKCGVIGNPELFEYLEKVNARQLRRDRAKVEWIIAESVKLKAKIVSADEREGGLRRVLNFGHTIGHALEAETAYRHFLHGEAVAWGMIAAAHIAASVGRIRQSDAERIRDAAFNLGPLPKVEVRSRNILHLLLSDKKTRDGVVHFVLPTAIGQVEIANDVPDRVVCEAVDELRRLSQEKLVFP
jgi:3-dehydroquinate synthase